MESQVPQQNLQIVQQTGIFEELIILLHVLWSSLQDLWVFKIDGDSGLLSSWLVCFRDEFEYGVIKLSFAVFVQFFDQKQTGPHADVLIHSIHAEWAKIVHKVLV